MTHYAGDGPWYPAIHAKLTGIAQALPQRPAWYEQWLQLGPQSSDEQRLRVYQAVRNAGVLPADAGFHLVTWHIDAMSSLAAEVELHALEDQMDSVKRRHGLAEDDFWLPEEAPAEYEQLRQTYQTAWDAIYVRLLRHHGEHEAAELFCQDHQEFERKAEAGREYFHGPLGDDDAPPWLYEFIDTVAEQMTADSPTGPLRFGYTQEDDFWEVAMFPSPVELVGGAQDGEVVFTGFSLDLEGVREAFESVTAMGWHSLGLDPDEGPYVFVEGVVAGHEVHLRVLAQPPEEEEPGMKLDVSRRRRER
jgi:hypothetical protein